MIRKNLWVNGIEAYYVIIWPFGCVWKRGVNRLTLKSDQVYGFFIRKWWETSEFGDCLFSDTARQSQGGTWGVTLMILDQLQGLEPGRLMYQQGAWNHPLLDPKKMVYDMNKSLWKTMNHYFSAFFFGGWWLLTWFWDARLSDPTLMFESSKFRRGEFRSWNVLLCLWWVPGTIISVVTLAFSESSHIRVTIPAASAFWSALSGWEGSPGRWRVGPKSPCSHSVQSYDCHNFRWPSPCSSSLEPSTIFCVQF